MDASRWFSSYWRWPHARMWQRGRSHRRPFPRRPTGTRMGAWICEALALVRSARGSEDRGNASSISPGNLAVGGPRVAKEHCYAFLSAMLCSSHTAQPPIADPFRVLMASVGAIGCTDRYCRRRDTRALDHHPRRRACLAEGHLLQRSDLVVPHAMTPGVLARTAGANLRSPARCDGQGVSRWSGTAARSATIL